MGITRAIAWAGVKTAASSVPIWAWVAAGLLSAGLFYGHTRYVAGEQAVQVKFDAYRNNVIAKTHAALIAARRAETAQAGAIAAITEQLHQDKAHALAKQNSVIAGLRAGTVRLQKHWRCDASVSQAAGGSGRADDGAELRGNSAGRVIGAGAQCDAQVRALQAVILAERAGS